jgi:hypothetical protein
LVQIVQGFLQDFRENPGCFRGAVRGMLKF